MEYTYSLGDMFETYTGTPEEIARLIELKDTQDNNVTIHTINLTGQVDIEKIVKEIKGGLRLMITSTL